MDGGEGGDREDDRGGGQLPQHWVSSCPGSETRAVHAGTPLGSQSLLEQDRRPADPRGHSVFIPFVWGLGTCACRLTHMCSHLYIHAFSHPHTLATQTQQVRSLRCEALPPPPRRARVTPPIRGDRGSRGWALASAMALHGNPATCLQV